MTGSVNFEAFGQVAGTTGSSASPYMCAGDWGYRNDGDAGLMHVRARYYDAQVGRFITRDTVLSEHPYLYCEHEPVGFVDPSGADPGPVGGSGRGGRLLTRRTLVPRCGAAVVSVRLPAWRRAVTRPTAGLDGQ